jgi:hypothetical protein
VTGDPEREALKAAGLRVLRELAEGAVSDEIRLNAASNLLEWATRTEWAEWAAEQQATTGANGRPDRRRGWSP